MLEYRDANASDVETIALLHTRSWRENFRGEFPDKFLDEDLPEERIRVWWRRLQDPRGNQLVRVAVDSGSLTGFVCVYGDYDPQWGSFVDNLHVADEWMRMGIGSALMRQADAWLASSYPDLGVYLLVLESNSRARRFYERLGAHNAGTFTTEGHGGAMVRSCRYTWPHPGRLPAAQQVAAADAKGVVPNGRGTVWRRAWLPRRWWSAPLAQLSSYPLNRAANHRDDQKRRLRLALESPKPRNALAEQIRDLCRSSVAYLEPHNLRWRALNETPLSEVVVLRDDSKAILAGMLPNPTVGLGTEPNAVNMRASRILGLKELDKLRAAAKERQARTSSVVRLGKSPSISSFVIPPARYSSTS